MVLRKLGTALMAGLFLSLLLTHSALARAGRSGSAHAGVTAGWQVPAAHGRRGAPTQNPMEALMRARASIVGGHRAAAGMFPWMAFVAYSDSEEWAVCSGTVVAPNLVLTAAHCVVDPVTGKAEEPAGFRVVTGDTEWRSQQGQVLGVSRVLVYPSYQFSGPREDYGDAALLVLSTRTTAPAIRLARPSEPSLWADGQRALIAGWGDMHFDQSEVTSSLRWAPTVVRSVSWCEGAAPELRPLGELCTIDPHAYATGTCEGDSGGPLLALAAGQMVEIGVTEGGYGRCATRAPSIYVRSSILAGWVTSTARSFPPPPRQAAAAPPLKLPSLPSPVRPPAPRAAG